jgi:hypothetical protein
MEDKKTPPSDGHNEVSISSAVIMLSWKLGSIVRLNTFNRRGRVEIYPTTELSDFTAILNIKGFSSYQLRRNETGSADEDP